MTNLWINAAGVLIEIDGLRKGISNIAYDFHHRFGFNPLSKTQENMIRGNKPKNMDKRYSDRLIKLENEIIAKFGEHFRKQAKKNDTQ